MRGRRVWRVMEEGLYAIIRQVINSNDQVVAWTSLPASSIRLKDSEALYTTKASSSTSPLKFHFPISTSVHLLLHLPITSKSTNSPIITPSIGPPSIHHNNKLSGTFLSTHRTHLVKSIRPQHLCHLLEEQFIRRNQQSYLRIERLHHEKPKIQGLWEMFPFYSRLSTTKITS